MINFERLWEHVTEQFALHFSVHGPPHWKRVEENGLHIAQTNNADVTVVKLFAVLHDSKRENDGYDPQHGQRAAEHAKELHGTFFTIEPSQLELLCLACELHHQGATSDDPTLGACFDADRLDLPRVGIQPDPNFMSTEEGRAMAQRLYS